MACKREKLPQRYPMKMTCSSFKSANSGLVTACMSLLLVISSQAATHSATHSFKKLSYDLGFAPSASLPPCHPVALVSRRIPSSLAMPLNYRPGQQSIRAGQKLNQAGDKGHPSDLPRTAIRCSASPDPQDTSKPPDLLESVIADTTPAEKSKIFYGGLAFEASLGVVALIIGVVLNTNPLGGSFSLGALAMAQGVGFGLLLYAAVSALEVLDLPALKEIEEITKSMSKILCGDRSVLEIAAFCAAAGFGEEMLFRGILQVQLTGMVGLVPAVVGSSVLFAFLHFLTPAYLFLSFLASMLFGGMYIAAQGNITVPIIAHGLYDFLAIQKVMKKIESESSGNEQSRSTG